MPSTRKPPSYRLHKASGQAIVTLRGKDFYLGKHGTAASRAAYGRLLAEYSAGAIPAQIAQPAKAAASRPGGESAAFTVSELLAEFWRHAKAKYGRRRGGVKELSRIKCGTRELRKLYGRTPAADFGPLGLRALRAKFIDAGYSQKYANDLNSVVLRVFKWGASMELVPVGVFQSLQTVGGIQRDDGAKATKRVKPAPAEHVEMAKARVGRQVRAMIDLQVLTGARPGEVAIMRPCDIDTTGKLWVYRPQFHKTQHHDIERHVVLGPRAQRVVKPFLAGRATDAYLFQPAEADAERRQALHAKRRTPAHYGNAPGTNRKRRPRRKPGDCYTVTVYARAIRRACEDLGIPHWTPNQLRHLAATMIRKEFGAEAARILLGHTHLRTTEIYAERDAEVARRVAAKVG